MQVELYYVDGREVGKFVCLAVMQTQINFLLLVSLVNLIQYMQLIAFSQPGPVISAQAKVKPDDLH